MITGVLIVGLLLISAGIKGKENELGAQLGQDLVGPQGFIGWIAAIVALGGLGYVPGFERVSRYLLALMAIVILIVNNGVFLNAQKALQDASALGPEAGAQIPAGVLQTTGNSTSGGSGILGSIGSAVSAIASLAVAL